MPHKANEARRHKTPKARYRITNCPAYDAALRHRGDLRLVGGAGGVAPAPDWPRGRSPTYSDVANEIGMLLRLAFGRPWRQACCARWLN
jgi:hypothetical protein